MKSSEAIKLKNFALNKAIEHISNEDWQGTCGCNSVCHAKMTKIAERRDKLTLEQAQKKIHEARMKSCGCYREHMHLVNKLEKALET